MADSADIQSKLANLTTRQCQILYWVCHGKDYNAIAQLLSWSKDLVQKEMSEIYDVFELTHLSRNERRFALLQTVCPIHLNQVSNPETDCANRVIEIGEPKPNPETLALVKRDERDGLIPLGGPVTVSTQESSMLDRYRGGYPQPPPKQNPLPWVLVGVLGTLLIVALAALAFFVLGGRNPQPASPQPAVPPGVVTFIVTQPPVAVPQTVVVTQAPVIITQPPPTPIPPTLTPAPPPTPTATGGIRLAGQAYTNKGVTVTLLKSLDTDGNDFSPIVVVENQSGSQLILRWKNSFLHLQDDKGKSYRQYAQARSDWDQTKQYTLSDSNKVTIDGFYFVDSASRFNYFVGPIDPNAKYLIITLDQFANMTNLTWRFDLQP